MLLVLDLVTHLINDCLYDRKIIQLAAECFTRIRHFNASIVICSQNLFYNNCSYRTILHNCTHIFLLRTRNTNQVKTFGKTFLSDNQIENFLEIYRNIVLKSKYRYILLDFTKDIDPTPSYKNKRNWWKLWASFHSLN